MPNLCEKGELKFRLMQKVRLIISDKSSDKAEKN